jgi:transposase
VAIIETPHRFPTIKHAWKYATLSVARPESAGREYGCHASKEGNRLLKKVLMQAALCAAGTDTRFGHYYRCLKQRKGACIAQRTVARSILSTMYRMWQTGECYRETR